MRANVIKDSLGQWVESGYGSCRSRVELIANPISKLGGADFYIQAGEQIKRGGIAGGIAELARSDHKIGAGFFYAGHGIHGQTIWQSLLEIVEVLPRP